jgi:large subunit ribosomal protein L29
MKENADKARSLDAAELAKQLRDGSEQMFRLRFQMSMGQMDGMKKVRSLRKERARILTILRERELNGEPAAKTESKSAAVAPKAKSRAAAKPRAAAAAKAPKAVKASAVAARPKAGAAPKVATRARKSSKG